MANDTPSNDDVLVISDDNGNYYVIPRPVVEAHRLDPDQVADLESQLGDDVAGFEMQSAYMMEKMAGYRQSERLSEANSARVARGAGGEGSDTGASQASGHVGHFVTGVWRSLSGMRPAAS